MGKNLKTKINYLLDDSSNLKFNKKLLNPKNKIKKFKKNNNEFDMTELEIESRKIHYGIRN